MLSIRNMGHLSSKPIRMTILTDSQTTIDLLRSVRPIIDRMNQHLLDDVRKCIDQFPWTFSPDFKLILGNVLVTYVDIAVMFVSGSSVKSEMLTLGFLT